MAYGFLRAKQEGAGKSLGNLDMLIAAHAVSVGAILVTNDKAFLDLAYLHVSGLSATVNWATEL
jgi:tRNA(fMet)-specific endonuclease VapC